MPVCSVVASSTRELINHLGGSGAVARQLGLRTSAVSNWTKSDVPGAHHTAMLVLAVKHGVFWRPPGWPTALQLRWHEPTRELADAAD